ncbi:MAG TPA: hypothetical protein VIP77_12545 [Jiangellaceae bacterium]
MSRASGGAFAACLITAAIVGFAGGAFLGTQAGAGESDNASSNDPTSTVSEPDGTTPSAPAEETPSTASGLTLEAAQKQVAASERIDLTGTLEPAAEGVELQVQRSIDGGDWQDFPVTATTNADGSFSTWITTGQAGENSFRVVRADDDAVASEPVTVTVG